MPQLIPRSPLPQQRYERNTSRRGDMMTSLHTKHLPPPAPTPTPHVSYMYRCVSTCFGATFTLSPCSCATSKVPLCSADGSTHTESYKLYRKVKHRYRPKKKCHANGQRTKRAMIRQRSRSRQRRGEPHTEHGLGVRLARWDMCLTIVLDLYWQLFVSIHMCVYLYASG